MSNRCLNCFEANATNALCHHCGYADQNRQDATHHMPPGTQLAGKYLVGRVLGQGGFGITYLAWDMTLEKKVAVKEFFPLGIVGRALGHNSVEAYSREMKKQYKYGLERFLDEAKTVARFSEHPNIVTVREIFKANGTAYMVMNYIEGLTLEQYLLQKNGKIPFKKAIEIMMPIMDALREIHSHNLMHRDISPDNIFIKNDGRVMLIDFGAARQELQQQSRSISVIMKAGYSPIEQYQRKGTQGSWTDIYAVGATLYRSCTGICPPEAFDRLDKDPLELPSKIGSDVKPGDEQVLIKALAVRSKDRYQNVEEMQMAFMGKEFQSIKEPIQEKRNNSNINELESEITPQSIQEINYKEKVSRVLPSSSVNEPPVLPKAEINKKHHKKIAFVLVLVMGLVGFYFTIGVGANMVIPYNIGIYRGQVSFFKPHGTGTMTFNSGGIYVGEWENGKRNGLGTYTSPDGSAYKGEWLNGIRHGHGKIVWANGNTFEGNWEYDRRSGPGVYIFANGTKITGVWQNSGLVKTEKIITGFGQDE